MFSSRVQVVTIPANTNTLLLSSSPRRWGILFGTSRTNFAWINNEPMSGVNQGLELQQIGVGVAYLELNVRDHGDCVQREWYIYTATAGDIGLIDIQACDCHSEAILRDAMGIVPGKSGY